MILPYNGNTGRVDLKRASKRAQYNYFVLWRQHRMFWSWLEYDSWFIGTGLNSTDAMATAEWPVKLKLDSISELPRNILNCNFDSTCQADSNMHGSIFWYCDLEFLSSTNAVHWPIFIQKGLWTELKKKHSSKISWIFSIRN